MRPVKKRPTFPLRLALAIGGLALLAPAASTAGPPGAEAETPAAAGGWRVYLDPETGEPMSTPSREQVEALSEQIRADEAQAKSLEPALSRSSAGLEPFPLARGGRGVFLDGRFRSALVVRRAADGGFELVCGRPTSDASDVGLARRGWAEKAAPEAWSSRGDDDAATTAEPAPVASETWVEK